MSVINAVASVRAAENTTRRGRARAISADPRSSSWHRTRTPNDDRRVRQFAPERHIPVRPAILHSAAVGPFGASALQFVPRASFEILAEGVLLPVRGTAGKGPVPLSVYNACTLTWICTSPPLGPDIHANSGGYGVIAEAFAAALGV
jgi:hypothetical protein